MLLKKIDIVIGLWGGAIILCAQCILRRWRHMVALWATGAYLFL